MNKPWLKGNQLYPLFPSVIFYSVLLFCVVLLLSSVSLFFSSFTKCFVPFFSSLVFSFSFLFCVVLFFSALFCFALFFSFLHCSSVPLCFFSNSFCSVLLFSSKSFLSVGRRKINFTSYIRIPRPQKLKNE